MQQIIVDFSKETGTIKPMHAVNNGPKPFHPGRLGNSDAYREAGFPLARNHDASFCSAYGGEHTVDVGRVFPDFDADEQNPDSYDFCLTDQYCRSIEAVGTGIFYRLGARIEHESQKYHTYPPKDFGKWARICEHIIGHLCYGWADGLHLQIPYWEIWNEPDACALGDPNPCWQGSMELFCVFYETVAKHLKACFPSLKIGGPAFTCSVPERTEMADFVAYAEAHRVPLDFYSWHGYTTDPRDYVQSARYSRRLLDAHGFSRTELVLDEWNYMQSCDDGWNAARLRESYHTIANEKGAAFDAACMLAVQRSPLDLFMYYDARPNTAYNGLFRPYTEEVQKPYYAFWQFNKLYRLGTEVFSESGDPDIYVSAARGASGAAVQLAYYAEEPPEAKGVEICLKGLDGKTEVTGFLVDRTHDNGPVYRAVFDAAEGAVYLNLESYSTVLLQLRRL